MKKYYALLSGILVTAVIFSCSKNSFQITDPETGQPPVAITSDTGQCFLAKVMQKNKSTTQNDNVFLIERNTSFATTRLSFFDSLSSKMDFATATTNKGDSILLSTGEFLVTDKTTGYVKFFSTKADPADAASDAQLFEYRYNAGGYLIKKLLYVNGSATADYQTDYNYDSNLLTGCVMYYGAQRIKFLESAIQYDTAMTIKPWIYMFPDFFEGFYYLQSFNFGKKQTLAAKSILTKVYDPSTLSLLDTWSTTIEGYVLSKDKYVLQVSAKGDQQQGLGILFGTTRFEYACTK